jgi:hypothetical protein
LVLWRQNPSAQWPEDPVDIAKLRENMWTGIDNLIKSGDIKEFGFFLDGISGYAIGNKDSATAFKNVNMFLPYYTSEIHEIMPYERGREILNALWKAQAATSRKQSQR